MKFILIIFLSSQCLMVSSQSKQDYNWQLGRSSSPVDHSSPRSLEITFNNSERMIRTFYRPMYMGHFSASLSDVNGNLLLYSNGCLINNGKHESIEGSENLSPGSIDQEWCDQNALNYPIKEGGLFLPFYVDSLVILLHQRLSVTGPPLTIYVDALFYTMLKKSGESYNIIEKSIPIIEDSLTYGRLEAIRGEKEDYWWVIQGIRNSNEYYTMGWKSGILDTAFIQVIGDSTVRKGEAAAQSVFSSDGKKYARYAPADDLFLFDFDISSGELSNYRKIHVADSGLIGGLAFSPNSRFLYACTVQDLYQFDVSMSDIQSTRTHIAQYDGFVSGLPATFYFMQLGPDCKIYMIPPNGIDIMHVINYPDNKGTACDFRQHGIVLPSNSTITIPNFPVFRSFPDLPCDPNISTSFEEPNSVFSQFIAFPNPTRDVINIQMEDISNDGEIQVSIIGLSGNLLLTKRLEYAREAIQLDLSALHAGIYIMQIQYKTDLLFGKIIKMH